MHLNFLLEFSLSHHGMIYEIRRELDVIKTAMIARQAGISFEVCQRIMVMPLRKLLCELGEKNDLLRKVCPDFRMPPIEGLEKLTEYSPGEPPLHLWVHRTSVPPLDTWKPLEQWLQSTIAYFEEANDKYHVFTLQLFESIIKKLRGNDKVMFSNRFNLESITVDGTREDVYVQINQKDTETQDITHILHEVGYYSTTVERFIKHMSDKRGAHIDVGFAQMFNVINGTELSTTTTIEALSIYLIVAVMKQIGELSDYYPQLLKVANLSASSR